ncbi:MAG TPA: TIR domain-containing protein [Ktedonobacteraceae bacterium]|jgi:predicted nucleotide-binding protein
MDNYAQPEQNSTQNVYVIYGRNIVMRDAMHDFLDALGLQPVTKEAVVNSLKGSPFAANILHTIFESAKAIIVLFTTEEYARLRRELQKPIGKKEAEEFRPQPGMDQIFEAGYALGRFSKRTILLQIGQVELFSDLDGRYMPNFTGKEGERRNLINRLISIGCTLQIDESRWRSAGNFQPPISSS